MRRVYLIRHAMPDLPIGERWCVGGRTDLPLGTLGRLQAALLPFMPELETVSAVFCSHLIRSRETALPLCPDPIPVPGVEEQDMGVWDGLSFAEIRARYPALYAAREADPSLLPEGAESMDAVGRRMREGVLSCLEKSEGDIAVVSHKSAIASLTGERKRLGYTSVSVLRCEGGALSTERIGILPHPELDDAVCGALLCAAGADEALRAHCRAVAALAGELCEKLRAAGLPLDAKAVRSAALLHDLARGEENHPARGALWLRELGYPEIADLVRQHHDPDSAAVHEAAVVFLADKAVRGDRRVDPEERFAASLEKCRSEEALAAHRRRWALTRAIRDNMNQIIHTDILTQEGIS